jgi:hypothetical protein
MIINIILASEKRKLVEAEKEKRAIEKEEQRRMEEEKLIHDWTESILYSLKVGIENKNNSYDFTYYLRYNDYFDTFTSSQREATNNIFNECLLIVKKVLEAKGYFVDIYEYSSYYQFQDGRFGYIAVSW